MRALIILLVILVLAYVARRIWKSVLQLRVGAIPDDVDVPEVHMEADRGWQVVRRVRGGVATIDVTHPVEGVARSPSRARSRHPRTGLIILPHY